VSAADLTSRVNGLVRLNPRKGFAESAKFLCPCHDDRRASVDLDVTSDGRVLLICRACQASGPMICEALGLATDTLFPPRRAHFDDRTRPPRTPPLERDAIRLAAELLDEAALCAVVLWGQREPNDVEHQALDLLLDNACTVRRVLVAAGLRPRTRAAIGAR